MDNHIGDPRTTDQDYLSYLMRLLRTQSGETQVWRVLLEEPLTQQVHRFDDLHSLLAFLLAQTGQEGQAGRTSGASGNIRITNQTIREQR